MQDTIALEIVNYLYFTEQYEQALHACKPLLNKRIDSPTQLIIKEACRPQKVSIHKKAASLVS